MPYRQARRDSVVDLLARVPVNRGSLLKSIENLLKTIESSESAVMIPTLLRDKCEFDAWELLFVAKILKASILGHSDLVEFYMNHMGHSVNQQPGNNGNNNINVNNQTDCQISPTNPRQLSPVPSAGSTEVNPSDNFSTNGSTASTLSNTISFTVNSTVSSSSYSTNNYSTPMQSLNGSSSKCLTNNWTNNQPTTGMAASNSLSSSCGSSPNDSNSNNNSVSISTSTSNSTTSSSSTSTETFGNQIDPVQTQDVLLASRPLLMRLAQPPSLLQLTTTNNHINSVTAGFSTSSLEQLTSQLTSMQTNGCLTGGGVVGSGANRGLDGTLSISTSSANQQSSTNSGSIVSGLTTTPTGQPPELRTSRSAGCLFRANSGASSPRTPAQTPSGTYPQAETLNSGQVNGLSSDPSAPVKLLLQIEQLKSSISHVTKLLESIVELYKKSIDNLAVS